MLAVVFAEPYADVVPQDLELMQLRPATPTPPTTRETTTQETAESHDFFEELVPDLEDT